MMKQPRKNTPDFTSISFIHFITLSLLRAQISNMVLPITNCAIRATDQEIHTAWMIIDAVFLVQQHH